MISSRGLGILTATILMSGVFALQAPHAMSTNAAEDVVGATIGDCCHGVLHNSLGCSDASCTGSVSWCEHAYDDEEDCNPGGSPCSDGDDCPDPEHCT